MTDEVAAEILAMVQRLRVIREGLAGNLEREWLESAIMHIDDVLVLHQKPCSCCGDQGWQETTDPVVTDFTQALSILDKDGVAHDMETNKEGRVFGVFVSPIFKHVPDRQRQEMLTDALTKTLGEVVVADRLGAIMALTPREWAHQEGAT